VAKAKELEAAHSDLVRPLICSGYVVDNKLRRGGVEVNIYVRSGISRQARAIGATSTSYTQKSV
jgi:hypothetical protein